MIHALILAAEITSSAIVGLIAAGFVTATIRSWFGLETTYTVAEYEAQAAAEGWAHRSIVAFDIAVNVIILRGQQDETISTHAYRAARAGKRWGRLMTWWLCLFQRNHGKAAAAGDLQRAKTRVAVLSKILGLN